MFVSLVQEKSHECGIYDYMYGRECMQFFSFLIWKHFYTPSSILFSFFSLFNREYLTCGFVCVWVLECV